MVEGPSVTHLKKKKKKKVSSLKLAAASVPPSARPAPSPRRPPYAQQDHAEGDGDHPEQPGALEVAAAILQPLRARPRRHPVALFPAVGRRRR